VATGIWRFTHIACSPLLSPKNFFYW